MKSFHPRPRTTAGFSLVEASLAMGIAAVGIMTLIGLVPSGLDTLREAASDVAEAKITQAVAADYQMIDWGQRVELKPDDKEYYFDQRGLEVTRGSFAHQFTAQAKVDVNNPQMTGDPTGNIYLRRVTVKVTDRINDSDAFSNPRKHHTYGVIVNYVDQTGRMQTPKK